MKLLHLVVCAILISAASAAIFGICVELCNSSALLRALIGTNGCPDGYECRSNGCGHTCQPVAVKRACLGAICALYCPYGHKVSPEGCMLCSCNPNPLIAALQ